MQFWLDGRKVPNNTDIIMSAGCNKVVSDIFGFYWAFDKIWKYGFIHAFSTIFESYNPLSFRNIKKVWKRRKGMYQLFNARGL